MSYLTDIFLFKDLDIKFLENKYQVCLKLGIDNNEIKDYIYSLNPSLKQLFNINFHIQICMELIQNKVYEYITNNFEKLDNYSLNKENSEKLLATIQNKFENNNMFINYCDSRYNNALNDFDDEDDIETISKKIVEYYYINVIN